VSSHSATILWQRATEGFSYAEYNREHQWHFGSGSRWPASAAPQYLGNGRHTDPEEAFVAAVSSCHMLSFLAICARKRIVVDRYVDQAIGTLEKNTRGRLAISRVELAPVISFAGPPPAADTLAGIHELAHRECFIANSVNSEVVLTRHS
jgi:organic hydroperoxide reductase OsmC/OhrA